jgi:hypothetical protein
VKYLPRQARPEDHQAQRDYAHRRVLDEGSG